MTTTTAQTLFGISVMLGVVLTLAGLILQWRRIPEHRQTQNAGKFRSTALETTLVLAGVTFAVTALFLTSPAYF